MNALVQFMNTWMGRLLRIVLGLALLYVGFGMMGSSVFGIVIGVIGIVPILMAAIGRCLIEFVIPKPAQA